MEIILCTVYIPLLLNKHSQFSLSLSNASKKKEIAIKPVCSADTAGGVSRKIHFVVLLYYQVVIRGSSYFQLYFAQAMVISDPQLTLPCKDLDPVHYSIFNSLSSFLHFHQGKV